MADERSRGGHDSLLAGVVGSVLRLEKQIAEASADHCRRRRAGRVLVGLLPASGDL